MERRQYTLQVRRALTDDAVSLHRFAERTFTETYASVNDPEDFERYVAEQFSLEQQRAKLSDPNVETWLCESQDRPAGYVELWDSPEPECVPGNNAREIRRFYVDQPWQGSSVASLLMRTSSTP